MNPPLDKPADMLIAADVVYAPEHAAWLRDCASRLLASGRCLLAHGFGAPEWKVRRSHRHRRVCICGPGALCCRSRRPETGDPGHGEGEIQAWIREGWMEIGYKLFRVGWA